MNFRILRTGRSNRRYLHIHGDEETARLVLERHVQTHDGIAYLIESRTRNILVDGLKLIRITCLSRVGADANLQRLNRGATRPQADRARALLDHGREHLVRALTPPKGGLTIALHNNARGYSVEHEVSISDETSLRQPAEPHAFFLAPTCAISRC